MERLEDKTWQRFRVFDETPLQINSTSSSIDGIRLKEGDEKRIPYVTRTDEANGIVQFVSEDNFTYGSDDGRCITVGLDTQTAFYQPHAFVTGQNIQVVTGEVIDEDTALFIAPIFKTQMRAKFNWGGNGATLGRMKRLEALLPVDDEGNPDWAYMDSYSSSKRGGLLMRYKKYLASRLSELEYKEIPALDEVEWMPVDLSAVFDLVRGREANMAMLEPGTIPLISARNCDNGLKAFVGNPARVVLGNVITMNNDGDGGAGLAYYQPMDMALDTHVTALVPKQDVSWYAQLFMARCISGLHGFFGHGRSISNERARRTKVMMPVTSDGAPDYAYMEQYSKNMMKRKYEQYLAYLDSRNE